MRYTECGIIRDLLPSYLDGICTDASRQCVQEHISACAECKKTMELLQKTELSSQKAEYGAIDAAKKIRQNMRFRSMVCFILLAVLFFFSFFLWISGNLEGRLTVRVYGISLPLLLTMAALIERMQKPYAGGREASPGAGRQKKSVKFFAGLLSAAISGGGIFLMYYSLYCVRNGKDPFGLPAEKTGSFLDTALMLSAAVQAVLFLGMLAWNLKTGEKGIVLCGSSATGIFLLLSYHVMLTSLSSVAVFEADLLETTGIFLLLGAFTTFLLSLQTGSRNKNKRKTERS